VQQFGEVAAHVALAHRRVNRVRQSFFLEPGAVARFAPLVECADQLQARGE